MCPLKGAGTSGNHSSLLDILCTICSPLVETGPYPELSSGDTALTHTRHKVTRPAIPLPSRKRIFAVKSRGIEGFEDGLPRRRSLLVELSLYPRRASATEKTLIWRLLFGLNKWCELFVASAPSTLAELLRAGEVDLGRVWSNQGEESRQGPLNCNDPVKA